MEAWVGNHGNHSRGDTEQQQTQALNTTNNVGLAIALEAVKSLEHCAPTTAPELTLQAVVHASPARARRERGVALAHVLCWGTVLDTPCSHTHE